MRKPFIAGNWKMNKTVAEAVELVNDLKQQLGACKGVDVVVCPPFTALTAVSAAISGSVLGLGAQNMHWEKAGAFTGEISPQMLRELYCHHVIIGHSERRTLFGETDEIVNRKLRAALANHLRPIMCIGETLQERQENQTEQVLQRQLTEGLREMGAADLQQITVAYEPVWAIGTGLTATPDVAQAAHLFIRGVLKEIGDDKTAQTMRIQYGGSMKPENAAELLAQPDIDGGLIGGAALDADSFTAIIKAAMPREK
ncbi:MAG: triose-phosphate isomerase [Lentisphaerae bacterium]|nr:triose-phosphate isomerase [Lentisphaerota bacterium]